MRNRGTPGRTMLEHGVQDNQQLTHTGCESQLLGLTRRQQALVEDPDDWVVGSPLPQLPIDATEYKYIELANIAANGEIADCMVALGEDLPSRARRKVAARNVPRPGAPKARRDNARRILRCSLHAKVIPATFARVHLLGQVAGPGLEQLHS